MKYKYRVDFIFQWCGREREAVKRPAETFVNNVNADVKDGVDFPDDFQIVDNERFWDNLENFIDEISPTDDFSIITNDANIAEGEKYKKICDVFMRLTAESEAIELEDDIECLQSEIKEKRKRLRYLRNFFD